MMKADEFSKPRYRLGTWLRAESVPPGATCHMVYCYDPRGCAVAEIMAHDVCRATDARGRVRQKIFLRGGLWRASLEAQGIGHRNLRDWDRSLRV